MIYIITEMQYNELIKENKNVKILLEKANKDEIIAYVIENNINNIIEGLANLLYDFNDLRETDVQDENSKYVTSIINDMLAKLGLSETNKLFTSNNYIASNRDIFDVIILLPLSDACMMYYYLMSMNEDENYYIVDL